jgi:hypothetical protein
MSALRDAIRRAEGRLNADEVLGCIDAYNAGAAMAESFGSPDVHIVYDDGKRKISLVVGRDVGPEAILAIEALIEATKTELDPE